MKKIVLVCFMLILGHWCVAQDELMDILNSTGSDSDNEYVTATFKSTRLLNGHSVETRTGHILEFVISHRFGRINSGVKNLYGLDQSFVRFALEYGITDQLNVGFGRSSFDKSLDGFIKYKILRQSKKSPATITAFTSMAIDTREFTAEDPRSEFKYRVDYTYQLMLARKFNSNLSIQLMPTMVHRNLAPGSEDNNVPLIGVGGRLKFTPRMGINLEYYHQLRDRPEGNYNSTSFSWEIETGGHVFQLIFSNATQMIEKGFLTETEDDFWNGDIHFGFNISRAFNLKPKG